MSSTDQKAAAVKHRACDECRNRKLACTKEPDGCSRCKREGIACHYSPQKPMGRPRKRPRDDTTPNVEPASKNTMTEISPDTADPGLDFLNFLTGGDVDWDLSIEPYEPPVDANKHQEDGSLWNFGYTGNALGDVNFDTGPTNLQSSYSSNLDPALFIAPEVPVPEQIPGLSPPSANTPESSASSQSTINVCACTANLYLALSSMQKLPQDVTEGVRQARLAAKTAYEVVNCPECSFKVEPPSQQHAAAAIQNFQTIMLLATLIPSIVHAYERILGIIDQETAKAQAERRRLVFKIHGLGGMWGPLGDNDTCQASEALTNREMEPAMWRLTLRALLRVDVYGLSGDCKDAGGDPFHLGLKDIVTLMENKSKARHAFMDAMQLSGVWPELHRCGAIQLNKPGETPTCQRIIAIAKQSVEQLVIA